MTTYREIYEENPSYFGNHSPEPSCLVWSNNLEHAVFSLDDEIHPHAIFVWIKPSGTPFILCYEKREYCKVFDSQSGWMYHPYQSTRWIFVELKLGPQIPLENNNPFDNVPSVFPQNKGEPNDLSIKINKALHRKRTL